MKALFICLALLLTSCISPATHQKMIGEAYAKGFYDADIECDEIQRLLAQRIKDVSKQLKRDIKTIEEHMGPECFDVDLHILPGVRP